MLKKNKNYWLYIAPHVYCRIAEAKILLYNTQTGVSIESKNDKILSLLRLLHEKKNLGAIEGAGELLGQDPYASFVMEFCKKGMGAVVDKEIMPEKPVQLMPVLNLQRDIDRLQNEKERYAGENVLHYLLELNLYLHSGCRQNCPLCKAYCRQCMCCTIHRDHLQPMPLLVLEKILLQIKSGMAGKINLLGGNIFEYQGYNELFGLLEAYKERIHIWNHYANGIENKKINPDFSYHFFVTFPVHVEAFERCTALPKETKKKYHFYITDSGEYEKADELIAKYAIEQYEVKPIFTGNNLDFFRDYIFLDKEDILSKTLSMREIFRNQKLNAKFFGILNILPDGAVKANMNAHELGNIKNDEILNLINKEMVENTAWRKIRNEKPCSRCLYQWLCPSPSGYEIAVGKPNLCHVIP
jgi:pseudo-rSAM protein